MCFKQISKTCKLKMHKSFKNSLKLCVTIAKFLMQIFPFIRHKLWRFCFEVQLYKIMFKRTVARLEMVVEVRPWSGRLGLNLIVVREPLFPFKNRPFQSYGPPSSAPIAQACGCSRQASQSE
jgi:hypothetical protein